MTRRNLKACSSVLVSPGSSIETGGLRSPEGAPGTVEMTQAMHCVEVTEICTNISEPFCSALNEETKVPPFQNEHYTVCCRAVFSRASSGPSLCKDCVWPLEGVGTKSAPCPLGAGGLIGETDI